MKYYNGCLFHKVEKDFLAQTGDPTGTETGGDSICTIISPWIVTLDALEPFACNAPMQDPPPLPYLAEKNHINYDIPLEVWIKPKGHDNPSVLTKSNFKHLYWTVTQQLAHHTINGCNLRPGDLLGTGTISGPEPESLGCLLELTWNAKNSLTIGSSSRKYLEDGDEVIFTACSKNLRYRRHVNWHISSRSRLQPSRLQPVEAAALARACSRSRQQLLHKFSM